LFSLSFFFGFVSFGFSKGKQKTTGVFPPMSHRPI
jgi:hypothetical protein